MFIHFLLYFLFFFLSSFPLYLTCYNSVSYWPRECPNSSYHPFFLLAIFLSSSRLFVHHSYTQIYPSSALTLKTDGGKFYESLLTSHSISLFENVKKAFFFQARHPRCVECKLKYNIKYIYNIFINNFIFFILY